MQVDIAVEEGDIMTATRLIMEKQYPSLYAVQMAFVNGNYHTGNFALTHCTNNLRNNQDIKSVHFNYKTKVWDACIPKKFQY